MKRLARTTIPILFCCAIFWYIFRQIPPRQIIEDLKQSNMLLFGLFAVLYFFWVHIFDCLTITHLVSRFAAPISHKETWLARGVSYFIMIINYHAAQAGFALYFNKTRQAPVAKTLGTLAFISIADLLLIVTSALTVLLFSNASYQGFDLRSYVLKIAPLLYLFYILCIALWRNSQSNPVQALCRRAPLLGWFVNHNLFLIFREARLKDYVVLYLLRLPIVIAVIGSYNLAVYAFGASIPWSKIFLYNPVVMLVSTIPLTPSGLGTSQFLTIEFLSPHITSTLIATGATTAASLLLVSSLMWFLVNQVIKALFGAICLFWTPLGLFRSYHET